MCWWHSSPVGPQGVEAVIFYLTAYMLTTLGAFDIVTVPSEKERDADSLEASRGLFRRRPGLVTIFTTTLVSLAGIPLIAGFIGEVYVLLATPNRVTPLVVLLVLASTIGRAGTGPRNGRVLYRSDAGHRVYTGDASGTPATLAGWRQAMGVVYCTADPRPYVETFLVESWWSICVSTSV